MNVCLNMQSPNQTARLAEVVGSHLKRGDCLLLDGPVGAGKTHFSRHLISSLMHQTEDVPSPTFTLIQTYETTAGELWHADLYRLNTLSEIEELGLSDAYDCAICLIEWPELLGPLTPESALTLHFQPDIADECVRRITVASTASRWGPMLNSLAHEF